MSVPSLFQRVADALFGSGQPADSEADRKLIADTIEVIVDAVEPRVRLRSGYQGKLEGCVRDTIAHLRAIGREGLDPILLTRTAWSDDPRVNAFFATADDVGSCLGRSRELRAFFDDPANREAPEAYALLGMKKDERTVLGMELQGDSVRQDVAQTAVNFSDHRIIAPASTLAAVRLEIGRRIIRRLAQDALSRIIALDMKANELQEHKAYLAARLRVLNLARDGMEGLVRDPATIGEQIDAVERELKQTVDDYIEAKASLATLDSYIKHIQEVFAHPEQHVTLAHTPLRMSRMGIKVEGSFQGLVNDLSLTELAIGPDLRGAIAIVRCPRSELPPKEDLVAKAERYL